MTIGTARWFDALKGYGFLKPDDGGGEVLVYAPSNAQEWPARIKASTSASRSCTIRGSVDRAQRISALLDCKPEHA
jgi:hypothetical protein